MKDWVYKKQNCNKISCKGPVGSLSTLSCLADRRVRWNEMHYCRCNREVSSFTLLNTALKSYISALLSTSEFLCNTRQVASILYKSLSVWHIFFQCHWAWGNVEQQSSQDCSWRQSEQVFDIFLWHMTVNYFVATKLYYKCFSSCC